MSTLDQLARLWLGGLLGAIPGALALVMLVWLLTRLLGRRLSPTVRCWLWWLVCVRLVLVGLGGMALPLPALTSLPKLAPLARATGSLPAFGTGAPGALEAASPPAEPTLTLWGWLGLLYAAGTLAGLALLLQQALRTRRVLRAASPLDDPLLAGAIRREAVRLRLAHPPRLTESPQIASPLVAGWLRPTLILPVGFAASVEEDEAQMVLAHELAHIKRGDLYLALVPNLARLLLFPLVPLWLPVCRAWASAREAACDAEALSRTGGSPTRYSRLLLKLVSGEERSSPLSALGATSAFHGLQERVQAVLNPARASRLAALLALLVTLLAFIPLRLVTSTRPVGPLRAVAMEESPADIADVPVREARAGGDLQKRYLLHGGAGTPPPGGWKLLIVLPGGDGGEGFQFFVRRMLKFGLGEGYIVAQPVAPSWGAGQKESLVWPTRTDPWPSARFTTEELVESVAQDVRARLPIDDKNVFVLGWASGGPAALASVLGGAPSVRGGIVHSSVYRFDSLPDPALARGKRLYLLHPTRVSPVLKAMADEAQQRLSPHAEAVRLTRYDGGYDWSGDVYGQLRSGVAFLERGN